MEFVGACQTKADSSNSIFVILRVIPLNPQKFEPTLSMRLTYSMEGLVKDTTIDLMKQRSIKLKIWGYDIKDKDIFIYNFIKNKVTLDKDDLLICFKFSQLGKERVKKMSLMYGLWEKRGSNKRYENNYQFEVEEK